MSNIIIGNGLLGSKFKDSLSSDCVFFCSGVSNSKEQEIGNFRRESDLLENVLYKYKDTKKIIYFSSILINQEDSKYLEHKKNMENLICENCDDYLIFRLPQVVGYTKNKTLISYLSDRIINGDLIELYKKAERNIIDIDDLVRVVDLILSRKEKNKKIEICSKYSLSINNIIKSLEIILMKKAKTKLINKVSVQTIDFSYLDEVLTDSDILKSDSYSYNVLYKYKFFFMKNE